jgi:hypothetical protein
MHQIIPPRLFDRRELVFVQVCFAVNAVLREMSPAGSDEVDAIHAR